MSLYKSYMVFSLYYYTKIIRYLIQCLVKNIILYIYTHTSMLQLIFTDKIPTYLPTHILWNC